MKYLGTGLCHWEIESIAYLLNEDLYRDRSLTSTIKLIFCFVKPKKNGRHGPVVLIHLWVPCLALNLRGFVLKKCQHPSVNKSRDIFNLNDD